MVFFLLDRRLNQRVASETGWSSCSLHRLVKAFRDGLCYMFVDLVHG